MYLCSVSELKTQINFRESNLKTQRYTLYDQKCGKIKWNCNSYSELRDTFTSNFYRVIYWSRLSICSCIKSWYRCKKWTIEGYFSISWWYSIGKRWSTGKEGLDSLWIIKKGWLWLTHASSCKRSVKLSWGKGCLEYPRAYERGLKRVMALIEEQHNLFFFHSSELI